MVLYTYFLLNDTATTAIYTLSLHDALPIFEVAAEATAARAPIGRRAGMAPSTPQRRMRIRPRSEEHTSELQSQSNLVCRLLLEKKKIKSACLLIMMYLIFAKSPLASFVANI